MTLKAPIVIAQGRSTGRAGVGDLPADRNTARNTDEAAKPKETENPSTDPGQDTRLLLCLGGDGGAAVGTNHPHRFVTILYRNHHL